MTLRIIALTAAVVACCSGTAYGETYTLDGQPVDEGTALAESTGATKGGCTAGASPSGEIACFTTDAQARDAVVKALRGGTLPPGFAAQPDKSSTSRWLSLLSQASSAKKRARAADNCNAGPTFVWTNANQNGVKGWFYYTGYGNWVNHTSTFNNSISSYWNGVNGTARWHDLSNGQGDYYGLSYQCREVWDLSNGAWNDRFTSYASW